MWGHSAEICSPSRKCKTFIAGNNAYTSDAHIKWQAQVHNPGRPNETKPLKKLRRRTLNFEIWIVEISIVSFENFLKFIGRGLLIKRTLRYLICFATKCNFHQLYCAQYRFLWLTLFAENLRWTAFSSFYTKLIFLHNLKKNKNGYWKPVYT